MEHLVVKGADVPQEKVKIGAQREPASVRTGAPKFISSKSIFSGGPIKSEKKSQDFRASLKYSKRCR